MRRKDKEIDDPEIIVEILTGSHICRLAMIDGDQPYIVPVNYGYYDGALYIHSARVGRKINVLKANSKVCFEVELLHEIIPGPNACDFTTRYRSVIGYGHVELISDPERIREGLDIIMHQHGRMAENVYEERFFARIVLLKLHIDEMTGKQSGTWEGRKETRATRHA